MEAIVLSRRDFREFDQIIFLYTKERGKVELLARGVKKIVSKNSAHLEPFSYLRVEIAKGKEIDHLTKVIPSIFFAKIRQNLDKSLAAGFLVSFINKVTETDENDKRIFELFLDWLKFVEKNDDFNFVLVDAFVINLFSVLGFFPMLGKCVVCEKSFHNMVKEELALPVCSPGKLRPTCPAKLEERRRKDESRSCPSVALCGGGGFYFAGGGIICPACREQKRYIGEMIADCGLKEISNMQVLLKNDWRLINEFDMDKSEQNELHKLIYEFVLFHSERRIDDWDFAFKHTNI